MAERARSFEDVTGAAPPGGHDADPCPDLPEEAWAARLEDDLRDMSARALGAELERRCLERLSEAWEDLNYRHLRSALRPPSIALHDGGRRWGAWDPARRLITIARRQVLCYTWDSAVETLRHEVAHQVVSELWRRGHEAPHGPAFREACALLGADPAARGDGGVPLFRPGGAGAGADPQDERLARIMKLLALADNNPDEHEARAAFARASELMLKYNLDPAARAPDYVARVLGPCSGRVPLHRYVIAGLLQEHFFVRCIWVDGYDAHRGVGGHVLEVLGSRSNVDMAEYVHDCLVRQSEALWRRFKRERAIRDRRAKRQYLDGLLAGFREQLERSSRQSAERGLVWVGDPALGRFVRARHPRTVLTRLDGVDASDVRAAGVADGARLRLHRPVASSPSRGRCLPG